MDYRSHYKKLIARARDRVLEIAATMTGKKFGPASEERRRKISEAKKAQGLKWSPEVRSKIMAGREQAAMTRMGFA